MKHFLRAGSVVILGLIIWSSCGQEAPTQIQWAASLDEAYQMASERNLPIVADFWRDG